MKKRICFFNRLYVRFLIIFGVAFSVLVLLIGVVFMRLYSNNVIYGFARQLEVDAEAIADSVERYSSNNESDEYLEYMNAITSVLDSQMIDVWVMPFSENDEKLSSQYINVSMEDEELSDGMISLINEVYDNNDSVSNSGYDDIYQTEVIRGAAPVHNPGGNIIGVVLLNAMADSRLVVIKECKGIIIFTMIIAWMVSFILALFLAKQLSGPISTIRRVALRLADGEYSAKTGIKSGGEIGELADTIDVLSSRLAENERVRDEIEQGRMDFFANVSHELRTPITVVRGYTESLADGYVTDPDKINHTLSRMLKECSGMERLVGDLLTLSKMQNPDFQIDRELVSVVQIFEDVIRSARVLSDKRNIIINFESNDPYAFMLGDYDRLRQMFMVIIDNAIKFSYENSNIDIVIDKTDRLNISIRDYGVGIPENMLPNVFEKFYKSKLQMNEKGSGLGLVIAKHIAMKHGGTISVTSEEGKGSCFIFEFDSAECPEDM